MRLLARNHLHRCLVTIGTVLVSLQLHVSGVICLLAMILVDDVEAESREYKDHTTVRQNQQCIVSSLSDAVTRGV